MTTCKQQFCSLFRFLLIIFISVFLATIFTTLLHTSHSLNLMEEFLTSKTDETKGKLISLFLVGFALALIFFSIMYTFIRLFHKQNKLLSNDTVTHEYLLQFPEVRRIAISKLEDQLGHLYLEQGRRKHKNVSTKLVDSQIYEIEHKVENLRLFNRRRSTYGSFSHTT